MTRPMAERFWKKVDRRGDDDCWLWRAALNNRGYGKLGRGPGGAGEVYAHRYSWELANGHPPPADKDVMHSCDTPACVNPRHLSIGTRRENSLDMIRKGRNRPVGGGLANDVGGLSSSVLEICERFVAGASMLSIAEHFGVSRPAIEAIIDGRSYAHVARPPALASVDASRARRRGRLEPFVREICERRLAGESCASLAKHFDANEATIGGIIRSRIYRHIPRPPGLDQINDRGRWKRKR